MGLPDKFAHFPDIFQAYKKENIVRRHQRWRRNGRGPPHVLPVGPLSAHCAKQSVPIVAR